MMADHSPILELDRVTVGYHPARPLLEDVTLPLARGTFSALVGSNGSGKSSLLKTMLGILPPLSGNVRTGIIQGKPAALGYVPQRETLDPLYPVSCLELVLMGCCAWKPAGWRWNREDKHWALGCLDQVGGSSWLHQPFSELSGGQAQRVLLARALAGKPDLLIMDEPTAGVDEPSMDSLTKLWQELHRSQGLTVLIVSHDLEWVQQFTQQTFRIHHGRLTRDSRQPALPT